MEAGILDDTAEAISATALPPSIRAVTRAAVDPAIAPPVDIRTDPTLIGKLMFSNTAIELPAEPQAGCADPETSSRIRQDAKKARFGLDENGERHSPMRAITMRDALFEALLHHMIHDER